MQTYFSRLATEDRQRAYYVIEQAIAQQAPYAEVRLNEGFERVYEAVVMDYPLYALWHPFMNCVYDGRSFAFRYINVDVERFNVQLESAERKIREAYQRSGGGPFNLYLAIYDFIAESVKYDHETFLSYWRLQNGDTALLERFYRQHGETFSPYGALVGKKAVCNGIAKLFQILCERFSLPCACVQARTVSGKNPPTEITDDTQCDHLLNVVEIDGQQAFVDITNGLPSEKIPFTKYDFFMVNYDVLKKDMLLRPCDLMMFQCNGSRNLYFEKNKLHFTSVGKLSRYLTGYILKFGKGQMRFEFDGKMSEGKLVDLILDILNAHCPPWKRVEDIQYHNGFYNCAVIDS